MAKKFISSVLAAAMSFAVNAQTITGTWSGELKVSPQAALKLVFHINDNKSVTMDSPDQGAYGIPGEIIYISQDSINLKVAKIMMSYAGHIAGDKIEGQIQQSGMKLPLTLTFGEKKANRPQTPVPPFPYTSEEITIQSDSAILAGTLTVPQNADERTPVVVMVTGSGQQNRDEELLEHKPFAVIADYLARNGIASFRYDDRGVGQSTGDASLATTADFASDAESVVKYLHSLDRFGRIGLLGHSEGGLIAYKLGARPGMLDFIISIAGPAVRGDSILVYQNRNSLAKAGITGKTADDFIDALAKAFELKINNPNAVFDSTTLAKIYPSNNENATTRQLSQSLASVLDKKTQSPWMQYFMAYSPATDLQALSIPAMIIYGEKDTQVPASLNVEPAQSNAPNAIVKTYPYANHLMQHAATGDVAEYKTISETISPDVLTDIVTFIKSVK